MFNWLKRSEETSTPTINVAPFGELKFAPKDGGWFGRWNGISSRDQVEVLIEVEDQIEPLEQKLETVRNFIGNIEVILDKLYQLVQTKYFADEKSKGLDEIRRMYSLGAISLKKDGRTFWVVLEPGDVPAIYDFFLRFTVVDGNIVWSNLG